MEKLKNFLSSHTIEEILKLNLLKFFNLEDKYTLEELIEKYKKEEFNEINHPLNYFKENIIDIKNNMDKYLSVYNTLLTDEKSKIVFAKMLCAKVFMSISNTEEVYSSEMIYYDNTIWGPLSNETYVDCGGYVGDTALQFISKCPDYKKVFIYEPLPKLAQACATNLDYYIQEGDLTVHNSAVYEQKEKLHFAQKLGHGDSCIKDEGELTVQAISLDEEINEPISFIKMDIEGSEKNAILGAKNHIKNDNPKMAICIYHLVDDFWKIPELVYNINPNYNFIIRQHLIDGFAETVLYCVPKINRILNNMKKNDDISYFKRYKYAIEKLNIYYREENEKMIQLIKGRSWFLSEIRNYRKNMDNDQKYILELKEWNKQLNSGKEYLENRIIELEKWIEQLNCGKGYLENRVIESENKYNNANESINIMNDEIVELKNAKSKLQYKFDKITNDSFVKKIIKWRKYDI